jgi:uncharacterized protein YndB with AHSA1/START domain
MGKLKLVAEPGSHAILMTRDFDAPRELVFRAFTDPELIPQWWGPHSVTTTVDQMEVKKGGLWRYVQREADGSEYAFNGVYHEITKPERIVYTFEFEPMAGHVLLETLTFEERGGKTSLTDLLVFQSVEDRDGMIASGMEQGSDESWDRFEELLRTMVGEGQKA